MLRDKVTEFYVKMDGSYLEFTQMAKNRPKLKSSIRRRNR
jgi:hypothetical protein